MPGTKVTVKGTLASGVECPLLRTDSSVEYSLVGLPTGFAPGDYLQIIGTFAEFSICMVGKTIAVESANKIPTPTSAANLASTETLGLRVARGVSNDSFQAAFLDAIANLPKKPSSGEDELTNVVVTAQGATIGGIVPLWQYWVEIQA